MPAAELTPGTDIRPVRRVAFVQERFEQTLWSSDRSRGQETDKAWDAIHRSLTDGNLEWDNGSYPLNHVILGGELLYHESDYILSLKLPDQVRDIATALDGYTKDEFRAGYGRIDPRTAGYKVGDEDFEYTWHWFVPLRRFYARAAKDTRAVVFKGEMLH